MESHSDHDNGQVAGLLDLSESSCGTEMMTNEDFRANSPGKEGACGSEVIKMLSSPLKCKEDDQQFAGLLDSNEECPHCPGGICPLFIQCIRIIYEDYEDHCNPCDIWSGPSPSSVHMDYGAVGQIGRQIGWSGTNSHLEQMLRKFYCVCERVCFALSLLRSLVILDRYNT